MKKSSKLLYVHGVSGVRSILFSYTYILVDSLFPMLYVSNETKSVTLRKVPLLFIAYPTGAVGLLVIWYLVPLFLLFWQYFLYMPISPSFLQTRYQKLLNLITDWLKSEVSPFNNTQICRCLWEVCLVGKMRCHCVLLPPWVDVACEFYVASFSTLPVTTALRILLTKEFTENNEIVCENWRCLKRSGQTLKSNSISKPIRNSNFLINVVYKKLVKDFVCRR
jgi:hypothetical protein